MFHRLCNITAMESCYIKTMITTTKACLIFAAYGHEKEVIRSQGNIVPEVEVPSKETLITKNYSVILLFVILSLHPLITVREYISVATPLMRVLGV
jgi:hypothetical protein